MISKEKLLAVALPVGLTAPASAQGAWTTGTASDRVRASYAPPYSKGSDSGPVQVRSCSEPFYFPFLAEQSK